MFLNLSSAFFQSESRPLRDASSFLVADIKFSLAFCLAQIKHSTESFSQFVVMKPQGTAQTIFAERNDFACLGWNVELTLKGPEMGESDFKDSGCDPTSTDGEGELKTDATRSLRRKRTSLLVDRYNMLHSWR